MKRRVILFMVVAGVLGWSLTISAQQAPIDSPALAQGKPQRAQPIKPGEVPQRKKAAALPPRGSYVAPRTPWGDPDITGVFTNSDESGIPFERPDEFAGRRVEDVSPGELAKLVQQRQQQTIERAPTLSEFPGATSPMHWFENYNAANSRAWLVSDPPDGKVPPQTAEARTRATERQAARKGRGPADSWEDRSLYDRCITRGLPGSMMPAIYGNAYEIVQTPDSVAIRYEMIHEARIIPLDGRPRVSDKIREYLGDARGRWDGNTLVVETKNFTNRTHFGYNNRFNSEQFTLTERFTPTSPKTLQWEVTFNDPEVWTRPFTFTMPLTRDDSQQIFEYGCHEGNRGLEHILKGARAEEAAAARR